jgi:hypothetical protein
VHLLRYCSLSDDAAFLTRDYLGTSGSVHARYPGLSTYAHLFGWPGLFELDLEAAKSKSGCCHGPTARIVSAAWC